MGAKIIMVKNKTNDLPDPIITNDSIDSIVQEPKQAPVPDASVLSKLLAEVEELKRKDEVNQKELEMLKAVADKGRVFNYESNKTEKKPIKVKLSVFNGGIIIGWQTLKDRLIKNPTTGMTVGEEQSYEVLVLDAKNETKTIQIEGYPAFSNARYDERIEAEVIGKKEDWNGEVTYTIRLNDGREIELNGRFVN